MKLNIPIITCAVLAMVLTSCGEKQTNSPTTQTVLTDTVCSSTALTAIQFPGKVKASSEVNLSFRVSGPIQYYAVEEGQKVHAGQLLVQMDPTDYEVQLSATEAEYSQIKAEAERVMKLHDEGVTTDNDNDKAVYGLQQITAKLNHHRDQLQYTKLVAPFDGYVQKRLFESGEIVSAGLPVLTLISSNAPEVEINIPASEYINRQNFGTIYCTLDVAPNQRIELKTISITPQANANQLHTMRLKIVGNSSTLATPGMNTMVTIESNGEAEAQLALPNTSVFESDGKSMVYIYNGNTQTVDSREVHIVKLLSNGTCIATSNEVSVGDTIVTSGVHSIREGEKVRPLGKTSKTNVGGLL